jgi:ubiquinone/menaquinone biosynthesis C-methylase UbiE
MTQKNLSKREKYDRNARNYDLMELFAESLLFNSWRKKLFSMINGRQILEAGAGTEKNIPFYPPDKIVTAIDIRQKALRAV